MKTTDNTFDYAKSIQELENIVSELQDEAIDLDRAMVLHEQGKKLIEKAEQFLRTAENDIRQKIDS
ncbi:exodeoxyribonuclease VII small subunit [Candidatus Saccharibacteria bacterium]|nr:exodeoxyribonuclease VII small subunit [Candidatus Saccharibacteria bacterium]HPR09064.1 exodeoxyribonuclease VII small subunit [Candidatus Saccharibacteria bacterium]